MYNTSPTIVLLVLISAATSAARQQSGLAFLHSPKTTVSPKWNSFSSRCFSSAIDDIPSDAPIETSDGSDPEGVLQARNRLIALSKALTTNSATGKFITRPSSKKKFQQAIADLEAVASSSSASRQKELLLGDWKLVATSNIPSSDIRRRITEKQTNNNTSDKKKSWFNLPKARSGLSSDSSSSSLNPIQKSIQKSFQVTQRIRNDGAEDDEEINRVDNVIEFTPLDTLEDVLPKESPLSNIFGQVNVNPLQVKKGKVVLIHKAEVESVSPLRTKIAWTSSVLNVAGTSQYFDESGSDIFGVNNLFREFLNVGSFDTPYVDEDVRVSRSTSGPILEQLRVFVRVGSDILDEKNEGMLDSLTAEMRVEEEREVTSTSIESQMKTVTDAAENVREKVTDALGEAMDDVVERVQDIVEEDLEEVGKAVEEIQAGGDIVEAVSNVTKAVAKVPADVGNAVAEDVSVVVDRLQDAVSGDDDEEDDGEKEEAEEDKED